MVMTILFLANIDAKKINCDHLEWTQDEGRSQGGGWIWFLGQGKGKNRTFAFLKAEGQALTRLIKECEIPHKEVKFNERCSMKKDSYTIAFARASIKQNHCREARNPKYKKLVRNEALLKLYGQYQKVMQDELHNVDGCNANDTFDCSDLALFAWTKGDQKKAIYLASIGCQYSDYHSCFTLAHFEFKKGNHSTTNKFVKTGCEKAGSYQCFKIGNSLLKTREKSLGKYYFEKSCDMGEKRACIILSGYNNIFPSNVNYRRKACSLGHVESCKGYKKNNKNKKIEKLSTDDENLLEGGGIKKLEL